MMRRNPHTVVTAFVLLIAAALLGCKPGDEPTPAEALALVSVSPEDGSYEIDPLLDLRARFSLPLDPTTVTEETFAVLVDGAPATGVRSLNEGDVELRFVADGPVGTARRVELILAAELRARNGERLDETIMAVMHTRSEGFALLPAGAVGLVGEGIPFDVMLVGDGAPVSAPGPKAFRLESDAAVEVDETGRVTFSEPGRASLFASYDGVELGVGAAAAHRTGAAGGTLSTNATITLGDGSTGLHTWDLYPDGGILDGGHDQYDGAWRLSVDPDGDGPEPAAPFPELAVPDVRFDPPFAAVPGLTLESAGAWSGTVWEGGGSCRLRPSGEASMAAELSLPDESPLTLSFALYLRTEDPFGSALSFSAVLDTVPTAGLPAELFRVDGVGDLWTFWTERSMDVTPWAGERVRLELQAKGTGYEDRDFGAFVDAVSLTGGDGRELLTGGDCETIDGWDGDWVRVPREVNLGPVDLAGLSISRSIYAPYDAGYWIRYLDSIHNPGDEAVAVTLRYGGDLGSDGNGAVSTAHGDRVIVAVDESVADPDPHLGMIPGAGFLLSTPDRDGDWSAARELTVEPGETVSILVWHLFGDSAGAGPATHVESLAGNILSSTDTLGPYSPFALGISVEEWERVINR